MSITESYMPLRVARSDGQSYDVPRAEQFVKPEDRSQPVDQNSDDQPARWKVCIGAHLKNQLQGAKDDTSLYILQDFPAGYELRLQPKAGKSHAYLYGHPKEPRARYRTPAEFVPHVLWLVSESVDRNDCSCHLCVEMCERENKAEALAYRMAAADTASNISQRPPGPQQGKPAPSASPAPSNVVQHAAQAQLATPKVASKPAPSPSPAPSSLVQHTAQAQLATPQVASQPAPNPNPNPPQTNVISPTSGMTSPSNVFRVGELVWYKHTAWRLGIVLTIAPKTNTPNPGQGEENYRFMLAPLGHTILGHQNIVKEAAEMRPFLTFSVPDTTISELQGRDFTEIDWQTSITQSAQEPDPAKRARKVELIGLEASKMAARSINSSFSTFNQFAGPAMATGPNTFATRFGGVYLGAEMICLGDPIRVAAANNEPQPSPEVATTTVMIVQEILLSASLTAESTLLFRGSIYQLRPAPASAMDTSTPAELGPACLDEINFRNELAAGTQRWVWAPLEHGASRAEADVQGRFYVTHRLMRIVDPARLAAVVSQRALQGAQAYLNNRMHGDPAASFAGWRQNRAAALGNAVSTRLVMPEGIVES